MLIQFQNLIRHPVSDVKFSGKLAPRAQGMPLKSMENEPYILSLIPSQLSWILQGKYSIYQL
jgi:hypothetical protein